MTTVEGPLEGYEVPCCRCPVTRIANTDNGAAMFVCGCGGDCQCGECHEHVPATTLQQIYLKPKHFRKKEVDR